jgi:hypothetical protein
MSADFTTVVVAVLGVAGTLSSPLLGQRIAARAKEQEFSLEARLREDDRRETRQREGFEERRAVYAKLNTAARQYNQAMRAHLRMQAAGGVTDQAQADLAESRRVFRDLYSDAQMVLPDRVLEVAMAVSEGLGEAYGMVRRLEAGQPRLHGADVPETIERASEYCRTTLYDTIAELRQLMREDLGVAGTSGLS